MKKETLREKKKTNFTEISEMLKAVAHPGRIAIIDLLFNCESKRMKVKNIYEQLRMEQPIASRHLGILKRNGLLKRETERNKTYYKLNTDNIVAVCITNCLIKTE